MAKEQLKKKIYKRQNGKCALSNEELADDFSLMDTDRKRMKMEGGIYTDENTRLVQPIAHMKRHGNFRIRSDDFADLKSKIDDREQIMKTRNKISNQLLAYKRRTDILSEDTISFLQDQLKSIDLVLKDRTKRLERWIVDHKEDPFIESMIGVKGIGFCTIAYCLAYIDLEKAQHASSLWAYAGLDKPSHKRYEKGVAGGGNKSLRCALWNMAKSQVKSRGAYREVYDRDKERRSKSNNMVESRNTQGKLVTVAWKDTKPCHRDGAALRKIMKHFLADYWFVGRSLLGLPTNPLYAESMLGHKHIIRPVERGWKLNYKANH